MAHPEDSKTRLDWRRMLPLIVIVVVATLVFILFRDQLSWQSLAENREALNAWRDANYSLMSVLFVLCYIVIVAFSLPGALAATLTGGFLFGIYPGVIYNIVAASTGAVLIFLAARLGLGNYLSSKLDSSSGSVRSMRDGLRENEISVLFLLRLVPVVPFFAANLIPALVGVRLRNFIMTTVLGIIPGTAVYTWVGTGLGEVIESGATPNLGIIWQREILGPLLALCALALLPIVIKAIRRRKD
ncbi:MAG: VTT domain-containing protein [Rhodobacteraceae bacterium]|nr:VTT domain-containing protein [Paracoccaceae bacterium]MCY4197663.1 VTT domain-containing protein [Paracoccaceae bacterium]MCY4328334.1 VTT domain-containing protein [Paracoccaceae bacterium]